jgi:hypothetical protein
MRQIYLLLVALLAINTAWAEEPFNGRVRDAEGKGVRATVKVVGSDKFTRTDGKGRFGLTDIKPDDTLQVIIKRDTLTVLLEGKRSVEVVVLRKDEVLYSAEESEELMNYGYGYVKRRESIDYSSGISGDRLRATGCSNLRDAIMICYPGLRYINGELCLITRNSINGSSAVLILCDGMETRPELINLYDVKSVEIIKGSNMYGFRGVNGVILVTTMTAEDALKRER